MKRIIFTLALLLAGTAVVDAQTVIVRKRTLNSAPGAQTGTEIYTPSSGGMNSSLFYSRYNHAIKLNPTALVAGDIPLSYEHKVTDFFTLEAGLGVTTFNITEDLIRGYSIRPDGETLNKLSYSYGINAKFFPEGDAFKDGYYVSINYNHRDYAQDFYTQSLVSGLDTVVNEAFSWNDIGFTLGFQNRPSERMIFDWYIGAAIRNKTRQTSEYITTFDPISGMFIGEYVINESRNAAPALLGGVKISVLFR
ncbi:MAG: hypothetical protein RL754_228 [Bacteroidota bacterium]|jgi:hypothetical protein